MNLSFITTFLRRGLASAAVFAGVFAASTSAQAGQIPAPDVELRLTSGPVDVRSDQETYIVVMDQDSVPTWFKSQFPGERFSATDVRGLTYGQGILERNLEILSDHGVEGDQVLNNLCFAGAIAMTQIDAGKANELRGDRRVRAVFKDEIRTIQTNTSAGFLGLEKPFSAWGFDVLGEDVVVGVLDTGVHPEHPSFADEMVDVDVGFFSRFFRQRTKPYPAPPASWNGDGTCDFGNSSYNPDDAAFACNNKLLGARSYSEGFLSFSEIVDDEFLSARDASDHGTHVASTAAGNFGVPAELDGESEGEITGIAPRARLSIYKVCWKAPGAPSFSCANSDSINAVEQAIADGVDVINFSVGSASTVFGASELAWLSAADAGIWVATSNGNDGPGEATVGTPAGVPWITSVGALNDNAVFAPALVVTAPSSIEGMYESLEGGGPVTFDDTGAITGNLVAAEPLLGCEPLSNDLTGQIAFMVRGECNFADKYNNAAAAGASALVVYNDGTAPDRIEPLVMGADDTTIPGIMIDFFDGSTIAMRLDDGEAVEVAIGPEFQISFENRTADFSSRGPNLGAPDIIKPDITGPGVEILAAGSPFTADGPDDGELFLNLQGTSMSSPHVAGVFALLHQVHPDWSPAMARSALMTTARNGLLETDGASEADPFDVGAGLVQPNKVFFPGIVYDAGALDYFAFSCGNNTPFVEPEVCDFLVEQGFPTDGSELNYPSIGVSELVGSKTVSRTVTSVARIPRSWRVSVDAPEGVEIDVSPRRMFLRPGESATYEVTFRTTPEAVTQEWTFGSLTWRSGSIKARSPIAVRPVPIAFPEEIDIQGTSGSASFDVQFGFNGEYQAQLHGLAQAAGIEATVPDDPTNTYAFPFGPGTSTFFFDYPAGTAFARFQLRDEFTDGEDDLDLYVFQCDPAGSCFELGSSATATSNEQVDVPFPISVEEGFYAVEVHAFETDGPDATYTMLTWDFGLDDDRGNFVVDAPSEGSLGTAAPITITWPGAEPLVDTSLYLGAVSHSTESGLVGLTLIDLLTVD
ncbi:MAG: S8 family serine peptidase [Myxococcota bacterium]